MKFRYYLIDEDGHVTGTDDKAAARQAADEIGGNGFMSVIDTETGYELVNGNFLPIKEQTTFVIAHNPDAD